MVEKSSPSGEKEGLGWWRQDRRLVTLCELSGIVHRGQETHHDKWLSGVKYGGLFPGRLPALASIQTEGVNRVTPDRRTGVASRAEISDTINGNVQSPALGNTIDTDRGISITYTR